MRTVETLTGARKYTMVDYNRCGMPLLEVVTEPDLRSPKEARTFLDKLKRILEYLEVFDGSLEGSMRVDANISLKGGDRSEVKNISGFKGVEKALSYEITRQRNLQRRNIKVVQETRHFDELRNITVSIRSKVGAHDYRYFPECDLVVLRIASWVPAIRAALPELPDAKRERFVRQYGLADDHAKSLTSEIRLANFYEAVAARANFSMEIGDLELFIPRGTFTMPRETAEYEVQKDKPAELLAAPYVPQAAVYQGKVREVTLGGTKSGGGSRGRSFTIGGATLPAYSAISNPPAQDPVVSLDVFDMEISLPRVLREQVREVMHDPAEWARMNVNKLGADMVTVHLMSTDPLIKDTSPSQAAKTVEEVLEAVDVPLVVGGCGDPKKDAEVFAHIAEIADGERLLLNSVTLDMAEQKTLEKVAIAARDHQGMMNS